MKVGDLVRYKFDTNRSKFYIILTLDTTKYSATPDKVMVRLHGWDKPNAAGLPQKFWVDHLEVISEG